MFVLVVVLATANLFPGRGQEARAAEQTADNATQTPTQNWPAGNPLKIALLKWYPANLTTSFKAGDNPYAVVFDGANIWVSNNGDNTVTKLRANDGTNLGTFSVGGAPMGMAFDGANIWVVNSFPNTVTKLQASDGVSLGEFAVGQVPFFAAFDGEANWVTNTQGTSITKLRASDGKVLGTFADNGAPGGIVFDGTHVWVSNFDTVTRFRLDGEQAGTFKVPAPQKQIRRAFYGLSLVPWDNMCVACQHSQIGVTWLLLDDAGICTYLHQGSEGRSASYAVSARPRGALEPTNSSYRGRVGAIQTKEQVQHDSRDPVCHRQP
jgi:outer membrane lipoprotein-sorting protein